MKLYLSSYRLGNEIAQLKAMVSGPRCALIMNAQDCFSEGREERYFREWEDLCSLGFDVEGLDLRDYTGQQSKIEKKLT